MGRLGYFSTIIADLGDLCTFVAPVTAVPLIVAILFAEWDMLLPMATVPAIFLLSGVVLKQLPRGRQGSRLSTAMCSVALFWFACAMVSGIPFMLGLHMSFTDAVFEGMAGWTGTAFSMIRSLDTAPYTLLFWRSYMQWVGGIGIIAFSVALASSTGLFRSKLPRSEGREEPLLPSVVATGRSLWKIYAVLTFCAIGLILFTGLSLWESVNLALSAISTGGFTLHSGGILYYDNVALEILLIPIMIAGALPFKLYFLIVQHRRLSLFGDEQVKLFFLFLLLGTSVLTYDLIYFADLDMATAAGQGFFMTVSALTSTGFQVVDLQNWAGVTLLFLAMLIFVGGAAGSTAGGIKLDRVSFAVRALMWWFRRLFVSGKVLVPFRIEGRVIPKATAELETAKNMLIILLSVVIIFVASLAVLQYHLTTYSLTEIVFQVVSAFSTCGINTGYVTPDMPVISKWIFILVMWIGRLEVIPVVILFVALFRGPD
ncbi:potassium transporter TrkG [Methanoregula sp.]|uniref:TrkH family potassium uptake protein n=1 Tax=Methanoregula sp. TaxID=2052170 RepID=UPI0023714C66|nr:potassium transporter TrkG [Methanoregula sp.]MDD1686501.1 TrkH family potassium uptake protein [Methanoregula sp.]